MVIFFDAMSSVPYFVCFNETLRFHEIIASYFLTTCHLHLFGGMAASKKIFRFMAPGKLGIPFIIREGEMVIRTKFLVNVLAKSNFTDFQIIFCVSSSKSTKK